MEQQRLRVASHFITTAAPASERQVEQDTAVLFAPGSLTQPQRTAIYRARALEKASIVRLPGTDLGLVACLDSEMADGRLLSSHTKLAYQVDYASGVVVGEPIDASESPRFAEDIEPIRHAALEAMAAYVRQRYSSVVMGSTVACRGVEVFSSGPHSLAIVCSTLLTNTTSSWAGTWVSRFALSFGPGGQGQAQGRLTLSGTLAVHSHVYEVGNVQLVSKRDVSPVSAEWDTSSPSSVGGVLVKLVAAAEDAWAGALGSATDALSSSVLKDIRRALPISGQKMNWAGLGGHRMLAALKSASAAPKLTE